MVLVPHTIKWRPKTQAKLLVIGSYAVPDPSATDLCRDLELLRLADEVRQISSFCC